MTATETRSLFDPTDLGPVRLRNRTVKCATNEGLSRDGLVTDALVEWHRRFADGGVGMTTLAYCSVASEGRTFPNQVWMREEARPGLERFAASIHEGGAKAAIQLGHAGAFAPPHATGRKPLAPSRQFSPYAETFSVAMTEDDLAVARRQFADAATLAVDCGFDVLEIHLGHGYLLNQFLSPFNNKRGDAYGGSVENRARFPREVLADVRAAVGARAAVTAKLNMDDGFRGGLTVADSIRTAVLIESDGSVDALQLTGGHTTRTPFFLMRGGVPLSEMVANEKGFLRKLGFRVFGALFMREYPFEEAFFLERARRFREATALPLMLLGGVNRLDTMTAAVAEGFDFIAMGRALIHTPDLVARMERGEASASGCIHCNLCVAEMEGPHGTRCIDPTAGQPLR